MFYLIVDKMERGTNGSDNNVDAVGIGPVGGNIAAVEAGYIKSRSVILHEIGHNYGFRFPDNANVDISHSKNLVI